MQHLPGKLKSLPFPAPEFSDYRVVLIFAGSSLFGVVDEIVLFPLCLCASVV